MKAFRQAAILEIVDREPLASQDALRQRLQGRGIHATQATISRDLKELGLVKRSADGAYQVPDRDAVLTHASNGDGALRRAVTEYLQRADAVAHIIVVRTGPGQAHALAIALDRHPLAGIVGTLAGDDTILVVARTPRIAASVARRLEGWARG
jgi:transcriptional regulator of arginine metabolism